MEPKKYITVSSEQTESVGALLAELMLADPTLPRFIALYGDLGVGKTAFVRGFTSLISPNARVKSPTFALVNEYRGKECSVYHFDMYRIADEDDLYSIGFYDYLDRRGVCLVEWSENIGYALPDRYVRVCIEKSSRENENERTISVCLI